MLGEWLHREINRITRDTCWTFTGFFLHWKSYKDYKHPPIALNLFTPLWVICFKMVSRVAKHFLVRNFSCYIKSLCYFNIYTTGNLCIIVIVYYLLFIYCCCHIVSYFYLILPFVWETNKIRISWSSSTDDNKDLELYPLSIYSVLCVLNCEDSSLKKSYISEKLVFILSPHM